MLGTLRWPSQCASTLASLALSGRLLARFFQAIRQNHLGMRCRPVVREHFVKVWILGMQTQEDFAQVAPGLDPVTLGAGENGEQDSGTRARLLAAKEQPILSANGLVS